jgi:hypothetical protein
MLDIEFVDMFMIYLHAKFQRLSSSGILIITDKSKGKFWFNVASILLFYILEENYHYQEMYMLQTSIISISQPIERFSQKWILRLQSSNDRSSKPLQNIGI